MSAQREMKPADIILQQLGGSRRLKIMINGRDFYSDDNGNALIFKFMPGKNGETAVKITLDPSDTYTVEFIKIVRRKDPTLKIMIPHRVVISKHEGIYFDMLADLWRDQTGLAIRL